MRGDPGEKAARKRLYRSSQTIPLTRGPGVELVKEQERRPPPQETKTSFENSKCEGFKKDAEPDFIDSFLLGKRRANSLRFFKTLSLNRNQRADVSGSQQGQGEYRRAKKRISDGELARLGSRLPLSASRTRCRGDARLNDKTKHPNPNFLRTRRVNLDAACSGQ
jgi:hypothetical protein